MRKIGFTGTQYGCTKPQKSALGLLLGSLQIAEFHHGDCIGADAQAHYLAAVAGVPIHIHPSDRNDKRAYCKTGKLAMLHRPKPPLDRNLDIVKSTDLLVACPHSVEEELRSGTWSTVRKARKLNRPVIIVQPDGNIVKERL